MLGLFPFASSNHQLMIAGTSESIFIGPRTGSISQSLHIPIGIDTIHVLCIGQGGSQGVDGIGLPPGTGPSDVSGSSGAGGGALSYVNNVVVTPNTNIDIYFGDGMTKVQTASVDLCIAGYGTDGTGSITGVGGAVLLGTGGVGGNGGARSGSFANHGGGGNGGAGGYAGPGGDGAFGGSTAGGAGSGGGGGGGSGGGSGGNRGGLGGGVGLYGIGADGGGGTIGNGGEGQGGSGGTAGSGSGQGGNYGGGRWAFNDIDGVGGGGGLAAVRIIWSKSIVRSWPSQSVQTIVG